MLLAFHPYCRCFLLILFSLLNSSSSSSSFSSSSFSSQNEILCRAKEEKFVDFVFFSVSIVVIVGFIAEIVVVVVILCIVLIVFVVFVDVALWSGTNKNRDVSTGPLAHPFARSLAPLICSLALHYLLCWRALLRSLIHSLCSLPRSWDSE